MHTFDTHTLLLILKLEMTKVYNIAMNSRALCVLETTTPECSHQFFVSLAARQKCTVRVMQPNAGPIVSPNTGSARDSLLSKLAVFLRKRVHHAALARRARRRASSSSKGATNRTEAHCFENETGNPSRQSRGITAHTHTHTHTAGSRGRCHSLP